MAIMKPPQNESLHFNRNLLCGSKTVLIRRRPKRASSGHELPRNVRNVALGEHVFNFLRQKSAVSKSIADRRRAFLGGQSTKALPSADHDPSKA
jgi:hypothetical protein